MNRYDTLPASVKATALFASLSVVASAGMIAHSWKVALGAFVLSIVVANVLRLAAGRACKAKQLDPDDLAAFHECFVWPFVAAGPIGAVVSAVAMLLITGSI